MRLRYLAALMISWPILALAQSEHQAYHQAQVASDLAPLTSPRPQQRPTLAPLTSIRPRAKPEQFRVPVDPAERECLASTVYHEARGESLLGQMAVAEVVVNRVADPDYPDTVCEVVDQPGQFSPAIGLVAPTEPESWAVAKVVALATLQGWAPSQVPGAVMFHSGAEPSWADDFRLTAVIDGHRFYQ